MFVFVRAVTFSALFIGLVLIYGPRRVLSGAGVVGPDTLERPQIPGMVVGAVGCALALWCIFTFAFVGKEYEAYCGRVGRWWPRI
jgi:hypothetical protein